MRNCDKNRYFMADSQRKIIKLRRGPVALIFLYLLMCSLQAAEPDVFTRGDPNPLIWRSIKTGYALDGFDPVSYFGGTPVKGSRAHEYVMLGAAWLFANKGNLEAFRHRPEIYTPQFGGHDAFAMSIGKVVEPDPMIWHVDGNRLYLFHTHKAKAAWLNNDVSLKILAKDSWQAIVKRAKKPRFESNKKP